MNARYGSIEVLLPASRQPEADHAQPEDADEREHEQDDRAEDRASSDERATAAPPRAARSGRWPLRSAAG